MPAGSIYLLTVHVCIFDPMEDVVDYTTLMPKINDIIVLFMTCKKQTLYWWHVAPKP